MAANPSIRPRVTVPDVPAQTLTTLESQSVGINQCRSIFLDLDAMPRTAAPSATIIQFPKATPRHLRFSRDERQALLALTYTVLGTGVDIAVDDCGDEYASLGAHDFEEGAWWTVLVTSVGFDVVNFTGYRVAGFADIGSLVERMRPHMAYMLDRTIPDNGTQRGSARAVGSRPLAVV